ncbi:NAD/NADP-dependent betaine aldehyde dehydrogenase [Tolypocladium ophioglossoides CBS 100239]|uniref:aldehyde dehydrogenase (NAD(+)) n=1 Tax=Tolypocladium ophioglossoides (strain CBS 100239) TaxID=1163406 RepID=A0A0L0NDX0_TOLOC|nr:NAD/NADP-dependent betaine aldehyde dehydrogenase [Tolypocladium ophioglossoides CBS 100239]
MAPPVLQQLMTSPWSSTDASNHFPVVNPATGARLTTVAGADTTTAAAAIAASQAAFPLWRAIPALQRGALLLKCADALESHREELAHLVCAENGKPYQDALALDLVFLVGVFRFFGSLAGKLPSEFHDRGSMYSAVVYEPYGVCVGILPYNWPPIHAGGKLAPCLAAGNTMILKPGDQAPLTVRRIVDIMQSVLPKDVVLAVPACGPAVPQALVASPVVRAVSFTGSTAVGAAVARTAADTIKPATLELGGKNALIVFDDADLERGVAEALEGGFFNKGEACTAVSRVLVHEAIYDAFVEKLAAGVRRLVTGNGADSSTHVGPCISKASQQRVLAYIDKGRQEGARLLAQGAPPADPACKDGFFVPPTLFVDVTRDMTIAREEIFGPVSCVIKFATEAEAVAVANEPAYGLTAIILSRDHERCLRVSRQLDVGMIWFNNYYRNVMGTPFGGAKDSGYGREHCIATLREWARVKAIHQPSGLGGLTNWRAHPRRPHQPRRPNPPVPHLRPHVQPPARVPNRHRPLPARAAACRQQLRRQRARQVRRRAEAQRQRQWHGPVRLAHGHGEAAHVHARGRRAGREHQHHLGHARRVGVEAHAGRAGAADVLEPRLERRVCLDRRGREGRGVEAEAVRAHEDARVADVDERGGDGAAVGQGQLVDGVARGERPARLCARRVHEAQGDGRVRPRHAVHGVVPVGRVRERLALDLEPRDDHLARVGVEHPHHRPLAALLVLLDDPPPRRDHAQVPRGGPRDRRHVSAVARQVERAVADADLHKRKGHVRVRVRRRRRRQHDDLGRRRHAGAHAVELPAKLRVRRAHGGGQHGGPQLLRREVLAADDEPVGGAAADEPGGEAALRVPSRPRGRRFA